MKVNIKIMYGQKRPYHADIKWSHRNDWNSAEVYKWCEQNFGHRNVKYDNPRWYGNTSYFTGDFKFRNKKDAEWFLLRWS